MAGISGILGSLFGGAREELTWRAAFLVGIVLGPFAVALFGGTIPPIELSAAWPVLVLAGFLVGLGSRMGSGCTSGHGVCGLARGAPRSLVATLVFFSVAALTVFMMRHLVGG